MLESPSKSPSHVWANMNGPKKYTPSPRWKAEQMGLM